MFGTITANLVVSSRGARHPAPLQDRSLNRETQPAVRFPAEPFRRFANDTLASLIRRCRAWHVGKIDEHHYCLDLADGRLIDAPGFARLIEIFVTVRLQIGHEVTD